MSVQTFGRRGLMTSAVASQVIPLAAPARYELPQVHDDADGLPLVPDSWSLTRSAIRSPVDGIPIATSALVVAFIIGFLLQKHLAFDIGSDGKLDHASLVATGGVSYDLVFGAGEWWRVFLAPLLHSSMSHLVSNCFTLFLTGLCLELMVGRMWFLAIFCLSALGGVTGSLYGNPHAVITVGASGGIVGLLGALFVASFHHKADALHLQQAMRRMALFFGVPAVLPVVFQVGGKIDYFAHAGGALTGALIALLLCAFWPGDERQPRMSFAILLVPVAYFSLVVIGFGHSAQAIGVHRAESAHYIPENEVPKNLFADEARARALLDHYPLDPRAQLIYGIARMKDQDPAASENHIREAIRLSESSPNAPDVRPMATFVLLGMAKLTGRQGAQRELSLRLCAMLDNAALESLAKSGTCSAK